MLGRKQCTLIGLGLCGISVAGFGWAPNFFLLMVANIAWGLAMTVLSGADLAFYYDTC
jgi:MFS family permease